MSAIFDNLNDKQCEAVKATEGKIRVIAGAGSGKTRVLAHRYAYLVNELGIDPGNILCMTFTNKAAQEMKKRISQLVHRAHVNDFVCTIHGFCVKVLRREIHRIGYPLGFIIIDDEDAKTLAKQVMAEFQLDARDTTINEFLKGVNRLKTIFDYIDSVIIPGADISKIDTSKIQASQIRYIQLQQKAYILDFDDIINFALYILNNFEDACSYWQDKLNYIMVDEAQDCSANDWALIGAIEKGYGNLFIVGDPDQNIYEWRGSYAKPFLDFKADQDIILNQNYRSTPNILDVANSIISHNKDRIPKDLFTKIPSSKIVLHYHGKSEIEEANWIATQIENFVKNGMEYGDFAILYRATYLSRNIEQALMKKQIKYVVWGGIRFFERMEIKDMLSYFRLIANKDDDLAFKRIINTPSRKFGKASVSKLEELASKESSSLYNTLHKHLQDDIFNKPSVALFIQLIDEWTEKSKYLLVSELFDLVFKGSGLEDMYRTEGDEDRLDNLVELKQSILDYESNNAEEEDISLRTYLQDVALYTNADYKNDGSTVKLMTIHQAKGLEFPYVFICGLNEGIFPNHRTIRERKKSGEEEERRLMYVAVTRAERALFLTESEGYNSVTHNDKVPSRFLQEVKDGLLEVEGDLTKEQMEELFKRTNQMVLDLENDDLQNLEYSVGDKVVHFAFGVGEIIKKESEISYKVRFEKGDRIIQTSFLKPHVVIQNLPSDDNKTILHAGNTIMHSTLGVGDVVEVWNEGEQQMAKVDFGSGSAQTISVAQGDFIVVR